MPRPSAGPGFDPGGPADQTVPLPPAMQPPGMLAPPVIIEKTEMAVMIQMKPSRAHAITQATSTASFRNDEIEPRPVARINIGDWAPT